MSKQKLTPWFPADVDPPAVGWWHTRAVLKTSCGWLSLENDLNHWWNGSKWKYAPDGEISHYQQLQWRGLASPATTNQPEEML